MDNTAPKTLYGSGLASVNEVQTDLNDVGNQDNIDPLIKVVNKEEILSLDTNATILARYMIILFVGLLIMLGTALYYIYKSGGNMSYILSTIIFAIVIFGTWGLYYQNTGKPFILYERDNINMPLQHISFLIMIIFIVSYALYIGYTGYNYETQ